MLDMWGNSFAERCTRDSAVRRSWNMITAKWQVGIQFSVTGASTCVHEQTRVVLNVEQRRLGLTSATTLMRSDPGL